MDVGRWERDVKEKGEIERWREKERKRERERERDRERERENKYIPYNIGILGRILHGCFVFLKFLAATCYIHSYFF